MTVIRALGAVSSSGLAKSPNTCSKIFPISLFPIPFRNRNTNRSLHACLYSTNIKMFLSVFCSHGREGHFQLVIVSALTKIVNA